MSGFAGLPPLAPISSGGQRLYTRRLGEGHRVVLLHGGPGLDHHLMLTLAVPLSRRAEILVPDLPGHGRSQCEGAGLPDLTRLQERTARWIEGLDPPASAIVGHSLGAWVARELIRTRRAWPGAAVLIAPPVIHGGKQPRLAVPVNARRPRGERALRAAIVDLCDDGTSEALPPDFRDALNAARLRAPESYTALQGELRGALTRPLPPCPEAPPVLVIGGARDPICPPPDVEDVAHGTEGARAVFVDRAGHVPFARNAEAVAALIETFMEESGLYDSRRSRTK